MSDTDNKPPEDENPSTPTPAESESASTEVAEEAGPNVDAKAPSFSELPESRPQRAGSMERFYDVNIPVWAELGRVEMPIGELMRLDAGSVLRLDRPVSEPVDIVSQGITLARGEVVVIDDYFAVRIKEIQDSK
jgi:flagellar motor switch protein FliN/FliY